MADERSRWRAGRGAGGGGGGGGAGEAGRRLQDLAGPGIGAGNALRAGIAAEGAVVALVAADEALGLGPVEMEGGVGHALGERGGQGGAAAAGDAVRVAGAARAVAAQEGAQGTDRGAAARDDGWQGRGTCGRNGDGERGGRLRRGQ